MAYIILLFFIPIAITLFISKFRSDYIFEGDIENKKQVNMTEIRERDGKEAMRL